MATRTLLQIFVILVSVGLGAGGCSESETPQKKSGEQKQTVQPAQSAEQKLYGPDQIHCELLSMDEAATILNISPATIQADAQEFDEKNWQCGYRGDSFASMVSFNLSLSDSIEAAKNDMAQYRSHLGIAKDIKPFSDDSQKAAYSEISGVGDEALWTAVNGTLTVRQRNISLQVQLPKEKDAQRQVAEMILAKLK